MSNVCLFFFNDTATTEIYTLSLHDALPISAPPRARRDGAGTGTFPAPGRPRRPRRPPPAGRAASRRSEEHTSELQSRQYLVCRLLLEKKTLHQTSLLLSSYPNLHTSLSLCP